MDLLAVVNICLSLNDKYDSKYKAGCLSVYRNNGINIYFSSIHFALFSE